MTGASPVQTEKHRSFRRLHDRGCFVMPNPWDIGSARILAGMGFAALATTSSGYAFTRGLPDGGVPRDEMLEHIREIVDATDLPVSADFMHAYADDPEDVSTNVRLCVETGVSGLSVEDMDADRSLYGSTLAVERVRAAREAIDKSGVDVLLTARCESFVTGHDDPLSEACRRLEAFAEAGADVLFAPGARDAQAISTIVATVAPKPVNVIAAPTHASVSELADLGVRRISLASGLARAAWAGFVSVAREISEDGTFAGLGASVPSADLNRLFQRRGQGGVTS